MRFYIIIISILSLTFIYSSCETLPDGPLAVDQYEEDLFKSGQISAEGKVVKVCKVNFEGCQIGEICWSECDFNLPDFNNQTFTITSAEICILTDNETATVCAEMFGQSCRSQLSDCQLATTLNWEGEYPEEHPFYNGFNIHITSSELLETVEAVCSITYTTH